MADNESLEQKHLELQTQHAATKRTLKKLQSDLDVANSHKANLNQNYKDVSANYDEFRQTHLEESKKALDEEIQKRRILEEKIVDLSYEKSKRTAVEAQLDALQTKLDESNSKNEQLQSLVGINDEKEGDQDAHKARLEESLSHVLGMLSEAEAALATEKKERKDEKALLKEQIVGMMNNTGLSELKQLNQQLELKVGNANARTERVQKRLKEASQHRETLTKRNQELEQKLLELKESTQSELEELRQASAGDAEAIIQDANIVTERLLKKLSDAKKERKSLLEQLKKAQETLAEQKNKSQSQPGSPERGEGTTRNFNNEEMLRKKLADASELNDAYYQRVSFFVFLVFKT